MKVGNKHGYTGVECKKERSVSKGDCDNEGEEEKEGRDDIFTGIKQVDLHALVDGLRDVIFFGTCRRK